MLHTHEAADVSDQEDIVYRTSLIILDVPEHSAHGVQNESECILRDFREHFSEL